MNVHTGASIANSNNNNSAQPSAPPPNPFLTAYNDFVRQTPFVTQIFVKIQAASYILSWIFNPHYALSNITHFTVFQLEIYRLVTSLFVNTSLFTVMVTFLSFLEVSKILEASLGSTRYLCLLLAITISCNVAFCIIQIIWYFLDAQDSVHTFVAANGVWIVLWALLGINATIRHQYSPDQNQRFLIWPIPVLYYPMVLLVLFSFLSGSFSLLWLISIALGYIAGFYPILYKYLQIVSASKAQQMEDGILSVASRQSGWVNVPSAIGSNVWNEDGNTGNDGEGLTLPFLQQNTESATSVSGDTSTSMPAAGRTLGTAARHRPTTNQEARAARLSALERTGGVGGTGNSNSGNSTGGAV